MSELLTEALWWVVVASSIPLVAIALLAGCASLIQVVTQIQEASLTHIARLAALVVVAVYGGGAACVAVQELLVRAFLFVVAAGQV
jgi:type III secretory pathway component EscS